MTNHTYCIHDLIKLMQRLRTPVTGCPWDLEQNYLSITPSTIEEVYEVVDAIERGDYDHLKEELGDLLFQIIFYAQLACEESRFDFNDIVNTLTLKLIRRHPHVFPAGTLDSVRDLDSNEDESQIAERWENIKAKEREQKGCAGILDDVPRALPSLQRAQKLQKRAAKAGMDWRHIHQAIENLESEITELREAIADNNALGIEDELGDVFFSCVNIARKLKLDSDKALRTSNSKFEARIRGMEQLFADDKLSWEDLNDEQLEQYWRRSKAKLQDVEPVKS